MTQGAVGFVGLGVMGEPMCRNLKAKCGRRVLAYDIDPAPLARLAGAGEASAPVVREGRDLFERANLASEALAYG